MKNTENNLAFIDGQNLHLGTTQNDWKVDLRKFRVYLQDKYHITEAYYFLGYVSEVEQDLYNNLQRFGFIVLFREYSSALRSMKKGNVDTDIVFEMMKNLNKKFASSLYRGLASVFYDYLESQEIRTKISM